LEKPEDTFFIPSPFGNFHLFNMFIINSLNKQKTKKCTFGIPFSFAFLLKSFI